MLNTEYILEAIRPYLTKDKKLRESDFNRCHCTYNFGNTHLFGVEENMDESFDCSYDARKLYYRSDDWRRS